jgi:1-acyl-sn-glycerol-3-phosphate acyltransferase
MPLKAFVWNHYSIEKGDYKHFTFGAQEYLMFYLFWRFVAYILLRPIYFIFVRGGLCFEGQENIPREGGVLITPNHVCYADPPTVAMAAPRHAYIMAWDALFKIPVLGTLIRWLRAFPVKPGTADRQALKFAQEKLKEGEAVIIFPEGGVSPTGEMMPLRAGVLMIAQHANVPIIPTIVENTNLMLPYEEVKPRFIKEHILVRFGKPVTVAELTGGVHGGEGYKIGAERLYQLMRALQENKPYPAFEPIAKGDEGDRAGKGDIPQETPTALANSSG